METTQSTEELSIKLLWDMANALPPENHTNKLLRSYYLTSCKRIARRDVKLPAVKFAPSVMCPKCCSIWSESKFSLNLKPQRIHSQKAQRLVEKLHNDPKSLTKKQRTRAKWLKKKISSNVEIKCEFCQKRTLQPLLKPKKPKKVENVDEEHETPVEVPIKKKKKKKAKDRSAGLKLDQVIPKEKKPQIPKKMKKPRVQPQKTKTEKVISKTQKQNSLLQLANMLKNRKPAAIPKTNNELEKFLR